MFTPFQHLIRELKGMLTNVASMIMKCTQGIAMHPSFCRTVFFEGIWTPSKKYWPSYEREIQKLYCNKTELMMLEYKLKTNVPYFRQFIWTFKKLSNCHHWARIEMSRTQKVTLHGVQLHVVVFNLGNQDVAHRIRVGRNLIHSPSLTIWR